MLKLSRVLCNLKANTFTVIAGFFTGGALAVRGGVKAARNSAIGCACLLAVIEGVGIGFQRMMAENTKLEVEAFSDSAAYVLTISSDATSASTRRRRPSSSSRINDRLYIIDLCC